MRGIFTAGVLDRLLELGLTDFDLAIGTSAGACNLASFVAQQYGRNLRCYLNVMARREFFSLRRALCDGHYMDLDWLWDRFSEEEPLDERAIERSRTQLVSVATCALTGEPIYVTARPPRVQADLKAGCAMPFLYRGPVALGDQYLVDGGLVDPIPAEEAYRRGARRIVVVRTRPSRMVKRDGPFTKPASALLYRTPAVSRASRQTAARYQRTVAWLQSPPADAEVLELAPPAPLKTRRTTQNKVHLRADYATGFETASLHAPRLREILAAYSSAHAPHA
jgi:predicted patatin/cPLA2 family phospholipase